MGTSGIVSDMQKRLEANHALKQAKRQQKMEMRGKMSSAKSGAPKTYTYAAATPTLLKEIQAQAKADRIRDRKILIYRIALASTILLGVILAGSYLRQLVLELMNSGGNG